MLTDGGKKWERAEEMADGGWRTTDLGRPTSAIRHKEAYRLPARYRSHFTLTYPFS